MTLDSDAYKHSQYGRVPVPLFAVTGWSDDVPLVAAPPPKAALPAPTEEDLDMIPF